jgi:hypothetical protein
MASRFISGCLSKTGGLNSMNIDLHEITVGEVIKGYKNNDEEGVVGYDGKLNIRPKYQREFIYNDKQRNAVIETIRKNFPLNVMYWVKNNEGGFEVMDGQQRTISICEYLDGKFSLDFQYFHNLEEDEKSQILNYKLMIYFCEGTDKERLDWFQTINIAGLKLEDQEIRNAIYAGEWLTDAKRHFSKTGCAAYHLSKDYMGGEVIRQKYLETAIKWLSKGHIQDYMAQHQHDPNANELWSYFQKVTQWTQATFPKYRREMKGIDWGYLYNQFNNATLDTTELEEKIATLMRDEDVTKKSGIYTYLLTGEERLLNIRAFSDNQKREAYETQKGICPICHERFELDAMEADHKIPWHEGGKTTSDNCQMLCKEDNRKKSGK